MAMLPLKLQFWLQTAVLYLVLLFPAYAPFFIDGKALYQGDISLYFEPTLRYITDSIREGRFPLWNPLVCGGVPQIAIISPGLFYLPNALFLLMPFGAALAAAMMLHQWLAGFGAFLFLRQVGRSIPAAIIGGGTIMLSGYMFGSSQCYTLPATFAWTPLGLFFATLLLETGRWRWSACLGLVYGMQILAGRPELFLSAGAIYAVYCLFGRESEWAGGKVRSRLAALAALVLGTCAASVALLPVVEMFSLSPRMTGLKLSEVSLWSAGWLDWMQVVITRPFGDLVISNYDLNPHYPGLFPYISSLFLGAPALTLALFGFLDRTWRQRWLWLGLGAFFFLLSLGDFGPLLPALHNLFPEAAILRYPIKLAVFALMALSFACAAGWDAVVVFARVGRLSITVAAFVWLVATMVGNVFFLDLARATGRLAQEILGPRAPAFKTGMIAALTSAGAQLCLVSFLGLLVVALTVQIRHGRWYTRTLVTVLALLTIVPLMVNGPACLWHMTDQSFYNQQSKLAVWLVDLKKQVGENFRMLAFFPDVILSPKSQWREGDPQLHSILLSGYERQILNPDTHMDFGLSSSYGFVPTDTRAFKMLYAGVSVRSIQYWDGITDAPLSDVPLYRFCQLTNTRCIVTLNNRPNPARRVIEPVPVLDPERFRLDHEDAELNLRVYEVPGALPRAYFRDRWEAVPSQFEALKHIFWAERSKFDWSKSVLINREGGGVDVPEPPKTATVPDLPAKPSADHETMVKLDYDSGERISVTVENSNPGFLVLADTQYPGWKAYDGKAPLVIYQANGFQKAVWLEPGRHKISFEYKPYSLFWGAVISAVSVTVLCLMLLLDVFRGAKGLPDEHSAELE